jgi:predicted dehydrogenase
MKRLRVAVAGAGMVSRHHLIAWSRCPDADVVAIADPDVARAKTRAEAFGIDATFGDAGTMLERTRPDALDIAASHEAHASLCDLAASRGVAILCQKPLAPSLHQAQAIVRNAGNRVRLMVHENYRFRRWYRQAHGWIEAGAIGPLRHLAIAARGSGLVQRADGTYPALTRQPMLGTIPRLMIGEVLVHHLDVACWLAGPLVLRSAVVRHDVDAVRGETAAVLLLSRDGLTATVEGDMAVPGSPARIEDRMELTGTAGTLRLDGSALVLATRSGRSQSLSYDSDESYQQSYDAAIAHFVDALRNDRAFETPPDVHLRVLALMEDAYRTAAGE